MPWQPTSGWPKLYFSLNIFMNELKTLGILIVSFDVLS